MRRGFETGNGLNRVKLRRHGIIPRDSLAIGRMPCMNRKDEMRQHSAISIPADWFENLDKLKR